MDIKEKLLCAINKHPDKINGSNCIWIKIDDLPRIDIVYKAKKDWISRRHKFFFWEYNQDSYEIISTEYFLKFQNTHYLITEDEYKNILKIRKEYIQKIIEDSLNKICE